jgi:hypothetical protein
VARAGARRIGIDWQEYLCQHAARASGRYQRKHRMSMRILLALYLALGCSAAASAWECMPNVHRFFVLCDTAACTAAFRVVKVPTSRPCGTRLQVEPIDARDGTVLSEAVDQTHHGQARGLYQFEASLYGSAQDVSAEWIVATAAGGAGAVSLSQVTPDYAAHTVQARRAAFEAEANDAARGWLVYQALLWGSAIIVLLALVRAVPFYLVRTFQPSPGTGTNAWSGPVLTQFLLAGAGLALVIWYGKVGPYHLYWGNPVLIPVAGLILLCEAWAWARHWRTRP